MDSLASIIVPCYNGEKFVDRCFDSILKQKYAHMEVIVVNDGRMFAGIHLGRQ